MVPPKGFSLPQGAWVKETLLSPFLFTLVVDALCALIHIGILQRWEDSYPVSLLEWKRSQFPVFSSRMTQSYFLKAMEGSMWSVRTILSCFEAISGPKVNLNKSNIGRVNVEEEVVSLSQIIGCRIRNVHWNTWVSHLREIRKNSSFWDPVVERYSKKLDTWKKAYISLGGRIILT